MSRYCFVSQSRSSIADVREKYNPLTIDVDFNLLSFLEVENKAVSGHVAYGGYSLRKLEKSTPKARIATHEPKQAITPPPVPDYGGAMDDELVSAFGDRYVEYVKTKGVKEEDDHSGQRRVMMLSAVRLTTEAIFPNILSEERTFGKVSKVREIVDKYFSQMLEN